MPYVLAVDGGNTKTLAVVSTLDGLIRGVAFGGCGDIYNAKPSEPDGDSASAALANVERTVAACLRAADALPEDVVSSVFNMAGADWPEDFVFWRAALAERGLARGVLVQNDALGVLSLGSPDAIGVSVVCGTGAATGARAASGRTWHSSFWQDEAQGSNQLGQKMLFALYRSTLGIEPPTTLTARVLTLLGVDSVEEVLHLFTNRLRPAPVRVDSFTPLLLDEAHAGDAVALRIVREHGTALGRIAIAAAHQVGLVGESAFPLVLAGGVLRHPTAVLVEAIVACVQTAFPRISAIRCTTEPVGGALLQALAAGVPVDQPLRERVLSALTPAMLLAHMPA